MKAILIDVQTHTCTEIETKAGLTEMYTLIGCDMVECVRIDGTNDLWVDEEGLLKLSAESNFFTYGTSQPLAGNGLILGNTKSGHTKSTTLTIEAVRQAVKFHNIMDIAFID